MEISSCSSTLLKNLEPMSQWISSLSKTGSTLMPMISPFSVAAKTTNRPLYQKIYQIKKKILNASFMTMVWSWLSVVAFSFWVSTTLKLLANALKDSVLWATIRSTKSTTAISVISKSITQNLTKPIMVLRTTKVGPSWLRMKNR